MKQHYVEFFSPGTFFAETNRVEVDGWNVDDAKERAHSIKQRYGATPYGFQFLTRERSDTDLDAKETARSNTYFLGGKVETLEEVDARNDPKEEILRSNMRCNGYRRILVNSNSYKSVLPLKDGDVVLDWEPRR